MTLGHHLKVLMPKSFVLKINKLYWLQI